MLVEQNYNLNNRITLPLGGKTGYFTNIPFLLFPPKHKRTTSSSHSQKNSMYATNWYKILVATLRCSLPKSVYLTKVINVAFFMNNIRTLHIFMGHIHGDCDVIS